MRARTSGKNQSGKSLENQEKSALSDLASAFFKKPKQYVIRTISQPMKDVAIYTV
jgi:hypothetical protein